MIALLTSLFKAFGPGASLKEYLSDGWNQLDCAAIALYLGGFVLRTLAYVQVHDVDLVEARRELNLTCSPMDPLSRVRLDIQLENYCPTGL